MKGHSRRSPITLFSSLSVSSAVGTVCRRMMLMPVSEYIQGLSREETSRRNNEKHCCQMDCYRPVKSNAFGVRLTHSRSISHSHTGGLKSHAFVTVMLCSHRSPNPYILNFYFFYRRTQNCCHQMHFPSSECLKNVLVAELLCP